MQAVVFPYNHNSDLQMLLGLAERLKLPFRIREVDQAEEEDPQTTAIRQRLHDQYVTTGEWEKMDDDERQDAALLEKMIWLQEQPDYKVFSVEESDKIIEQLKAECYAD